jgi:hypothetical protein
MLDLDQRMVQREMVKEQKKLIKSKFLKIDQDQYKSRSSEDMFTRQAVKNGKQKGHNKNSSKYRQSQDD